MSAEARHPGSRSGRNRGRIKYPAGKYGGRPQTDPFQPFEPLRTTFRPVRETGCSSQTNMIVFTHLSIVCDCPLTRLLPPVITAHTRPDDCRQLFDAPQAYAGTQASL